MTGNWWFPLDMWVVPQPNGDLLYYAPGVVGALYVWQAGLGTFTSPPGAFDVMVKNPDGSHSRITKHGTTWHFNAGGYLDFVRTRYALQTTLTRGPQNQLLSWTDYAGRTTTITYYANGYASAMIDWGGRAVGFTYTAQGYLATVSYPPTTFYDAAVQQIVTQGKVLSFTYSAGTGTALDGNLLTIYDNGGAVAVANSFDALDRATTTSVRSGTWTYSYLPGGTTRVVDPDGLTADYLFNATGAILQKVVYTHTGLGLTPLRPNEPNSYTWTYERNAACGCDLATKITRPDGSYVTYAYDAWGCITSRVLYPAVGQDAITETWTWSPFAQYCRPLTYTSPKGHEPGTPSQPYTLTGTYDQWGSLISLSYPSALVQGSMASPTVNYTRNPLGQVTSCTCIGGTVINYEYYPITLELKQITEDPTGFGRTTQFSYDQYSRLISATGPTGTITTINWNALDQVVSVAGPQPLAPEFAFLRDQNENLYRIQVENRDAQGALDAANPYFTERRLYDAQNRLMTIEREVNATTVASTQVTCSAGGRVVAVTDPNNVRTDFAYDERGLLFTRTEGAGSAQAGTYSYDYDPVGRPCRVVDPRGHAVSLTHDHANRLTAVAYPDGSQDLLTWNRNSALLTRSSLGPSGVLLARTSFTYDPYGNQVSRTADLLTPQGTLIRSATATDQRNAALLVSATLMPGGSSVLHEYDTLDRLVRTTDASQGKSEYLYDLNDNVQRLTRAEWNPIANATESHIDEFTYDALGRFASGATRDANSTIVQTRSWTHDGLGRILSKQDGAGNRVSYAYDARGYVLSVLRELRVGGVGGGALLGTVQTSTTYDLGGRITTNGDGAGNQTSYAYDGRNRLVSVSRAGSTWTRQYDASGNLTSATDAVGTMVLSTYDGMNRCVGRTVARAPTVLGTTSESYQYDGLGRLIAATDNDSAVARTYDSLGRMTSDAVGGRTVELAYDDLGGLTSLTYPDQSVQVRTLDAVERVTGVSIQNGPTLATYTSAGFRVARAQLLNGVVRDHAWDALLREVTVTYTKHPTVLQKFEYAWTASNQRAFEKRHHAGGTGDNYGFDSLYRTTQVKVGVADPAAEYANPGSQALLSTVVPTYDLADNRTQVVVTGAGAGTTPYTVDAANFYTNIAGAQYVRDANGNLRDDGVFLFAYDFQDQLVEVRLKATNALVAQYEYDCLGRRIAKVVGSTTITFAWCGEDMVCEYDASGLLSRRHYGAADGEVVAVWQRDLADLDGDGSVTDYVWIHPIYDGAYDCAGMLGPNGAVVETYVHSYDGTVAIADAAGNPIGASALGWQQGYGRYYRDDETGLLYARHRYYCPDIGRFITEDPQGRWHDIRSRGNGYSYLGDRYRNGYDPSGFADECPCGEKYVVVTITRTDAMWGGTPNQYYDSQTNQNFDALNERYGSSSGRVHVHEETAAMHADPTGNLLQQARARFWSEMQHAKNDPCFDMYVHMGHGIQGQIVFLGMRLGPNDLLGGLNHKLDLIALYCCQGSRPPPPGDGAWTDYTEPSSADPAEDFVAASPNIIPHPLGGFFGGGSGQLLVNRIYRAVTERSHAPSDPGPRRR